MCLDSSQPAHLQSSKALGQRLKIQTEGKQFYKDLSIPKDKISGRERTKPASARSKFNIEFTRHKPSLFSQQQEACETVAALQRTDEDSKDRLNFKRKKLSFQNQPASSRTDKSSQMKNKIFQQICRLGEYSSTPVDFNDHKTVAREDSRKSSKKVQHLLERYGKGSFSAHKSRRTADLCHYEIAASSRHKDAIYSSNIKPSNLIPSTRDIPGNRSSKRSRIIHQSDQVSSLRRQTTASQELINRYGHSVKRQPSSSHVDSNFFSHGLFAPNKAGFLLMKTHTPTQPSIPKAPTHSNDKNRPSSDHNTTHQPPANRQQRLKYTASYLLATDKKPTPSISMTNLRTPNSRREVRSILAGLQSFREKLQNKTDRPVSVSFVKKHT